MRAKVKKTHKRGLGGVRLSHLTDETTSPATQRGLIERAADDEHVDLVGWAEDLDVSAADLPPQDRPELGPWLRNPELIDRYDVLVFAKMDRAIRSVVDLHWLLRWCKEYGKELIFVKDRLDTSTPLGVAVATILAAVGEIEIANMVERRERASAFLRTSERWPGGPAPYGFETVDNPSGSGKVLVLAETDAAILREIVGRAIGDGSVGESLAEIADNLNQRGIPTSRARAKSKKKNKLEVKGWSSAVLTRMLRSRALLGQKEQQVKDLDTGQTTGRKLLLDSDGRPIQIGPPIITLEDFQNLQAALDRGSRPQPRGKAPNPLAGIVMCGECGKPLRKHGPRSRPEHTHKFRCYGEGCREASAYVEEVWSALTDAFLHDVGEKQVMTRSYVPGSDNSAELDDLSQRIATLREARYIKGEFEGDEADWDRLMSALLSRRTELESVPQRKAGWEWVPTDKTYGEMWRSLDPSEQGDFLKRSGIKVRIFSAGRVGGLHLEIDFPQDLVERLG